MWALSIKGDFKIGNKDFFPQSWSVSMSACVDIFEIIDLVFSVPYALAEVCTYKLFIVPCMALILKFQLGKLCLLRFHNADLAVVRSRICSFTCEGCGKHQNSFSSQEALLLHVGFGIVRKTKQKTGTNLSPSLFWLICDISLYISCWCIRNFM